MVREGAMRSGAQNHEDVMCALLALGAELDAPCQSPMCTSKASEKRRMRVTRLTVIRYGKGRCAKQS